MTRAASPHVITLGTAGGPRWWRHGNEKVRTGISTAVVIGEAVYLVDCGYGAGRQLVQSGHSLSEVQAIFLTHLHSDHVVDLASIALFSTYEITDDGREPILLIGPGDRGRLPTLSPQATVAPTPVAAHGPTPGTAETLRRIVDAFATDINDRAFDSLRPSPLEVIRAHDLILPEGIDFHPDDRPSPAMSPFAVFEDERVRVTTILVEHPPMAPAYGYRFDTDHGSVVISGDTAYTPNMVTLATGADLLLHEAIDLEWLNAKFGDPHSETAIATRQHHEKAHTSLADAVRVAREADVRQLALHHLVPGTSGPSLRRQLDQFAGKQRPLLPDDLDVIGLR